MENLLNTAKAPFAEKGEVTPQDIQEIARIVARSQGGEAIIVDKKRDAYFVDQMVLLRMLGSSTDGLVLTPNELKTYVASLNRSPEARDNSLVKEFLAQSVLTQAEDGKIRLGANAGKPVLIVSVQETAEETALNYLHEKRHHRFYGEKAFQASVLANAGRLCVEEKMFGLILLQLSGSYSLNSIDPKKRQPYEMFVTEIDAYAHMPKDGFDVTQWGIQKGQSLKQSVESVYSALQEYLRVGKNMSNDEIAEEASLTFQGKKAILKVGATTYTMSGDSKGQLSDQSKLLGIENNED